MATQFKIFRATGADEIDRLEEMINLWMTSNRIVQMETSMCQVANRPDGERFQCFVATFLYEEI